MKTVKTETEDFGSSVTYYGPAECGFICADIRKFSAAARSNSLKSNHVMFIVCLCMTTLSEVFPCFFLSCKANARVKPAKTGHGAHSS